MELPPVLARLEITKQTLSQYAGRNPNRNIGTAFARRIEKEFNLPTGWMDNIHHGSAAFNAVVELASQMDEGQLKNLLQLLNATLAMSPKKDQ